MLATAIAPAVIVWTYAPVDIGIIATGNVAIAIARMYVPASPEWISATAIAPAVIAWTYAPVDTGIIATENVAIAIARMSLYAPIMETAPMRKIRLAARARMKMMAVRSRG
jgi:hypothetical protein